MQASYRTWTYPPTHHTTQTSNLTEETFSRLFLSNYSSRHRILWVVSIVSLQLTILILAAPKKRSGYPSKDRYMIAEPTEAGLVGYLATHILDAGRSESGWAHETSTRHEDI